MKVIETERLILRTWREEDFVPFAEMNRDPLVMRYFPNKLSSEESDKLAQRIITHLDKRGYGLWAVEVKKGTPFIGFTGFNYTDFPAEFTPCIEIGWRLANPHWGKGYATEAAKACLASVDRWNLDKIYSFTSEINIPSQGVMQKIGMKKAGSFDHPKIDPSNRLCRHVLYYWDSTFTKAT